MRRGALAEARSCKSEIRIPKSETNSNYRNRRNDQKGEGVLDIPCFGTLVTPKARCSRKLSEFACSRLFVGVVSSFELRTSSFPPGSFRVWAATQPNGYKYTSRVL